MMNEKIESGISYRPPFVIHNFASVGSTNDVLKDMSGAPEFTCVTAGEQTAGRGRRDKVWHSSPGDGLYLSVLLRPRSRHADIHLISFVAAIAVAETIGEYDIAGMDIKWPNDVLLNERKVCGILSEVAGSGDDSQRIILGIGVNLNHRHFPGELAATATSIALESGRPVDLAGFRDRLLDRLALWYEIWRAGDPSSIIERWMQLSSYGTGMPVSATMDERQIAGRTCGLTGAGALQILTPSGEIETIIAGEVRNLRQSK